VVFRVGIFIDSDFNLHLSCKLKIVMTEEQLSRLTKHINGGHSYGKIGYDSTFDRLEFYGTLKGRAGFPDDFELKTHIKIERISKYDMIGNYDFKIIDMNDVSEAYEEAKEKLLDLWTDPLVAKKWIDLLKRNEDKLPTFNFWEHI